MQSKVPTKLLEMKTKIWGLEIPDLLIVFGSMALFNRLFDQYPYKLPIVWGVSGLLWLGFFLLKRGQPEHFLKHALLFHFAPATYDIGGRK